MPDNTLKTYDIVGNREDLSDKIFMASPTDTPFISAIGRTSASSVHHEWQRDVLRKPNKGNAAKEGADAKYKKESPTQRIGNRCQIVEDTLSISGTQTAVRHAGGDERKRRMLKKMVELKKDIEAAAISNATEVAGSGDVGRQMRGLNGWIAENNDMGEGGKAPDPVNNVAPTAGKARDFSEDSFKSAILQAYENGGNVSMALMQPKHKQFASSFHGNATRMNDVGNSAKSATLNTAFTFYGSDFGTIKMVPNRVMSNGVDNNVYGIDLEYWAMAVLRGFHTDELAKVGDARNYQVIWEGTLEAREERSSFAVRDLNAK